MCSCHSAAILSPLVALLLSLPGSASSPQEDARPPYPPSPVIAGITWDWTTRRTAAPGSDLWPVTWGADDQLYAAWGDGGGFGGSDTDSRVALGVARIEGTPEDWRGINGMALVHFQRLWRG